MFQPLVSLLCFLLLFGRLGAEESLPKGAIARLGRDFRFRHGGSVSDLRFSPDGKTLVSAGYDGTIRSWDSSTGRQLRRLVGHQGFARLALSSDGNLLVSGGSDATIRLWDPVTGQERLSRKEHKGYVSAVSLSPDGKTIASASQDGTVRLWDVASGKVRLKIDAHEDHVADVAFSPDGKLLASASNGLIAFNQQPKNPDLSIRLWDPATGRRLAILEGHARGIHRLAFSPDGKLLASASSQEGKVRLWEMPAGKAIRVLESKAEESRIQPGVRHDFYSLAFSPDGKTLAAGGNKLTVSLWEAATGKELPSLQGRNANDSRSRLQGLSFAPDGQTLAGGSEDGTIRLWDLATGKERFEVVGPPDIIVQAAAFAPDGKVLATAATPDKITLWDWASRKARQLPALAHRLAFSPDGQLLASAEETIGEVVVHDLIRGAEVSRIQPLQRGKAGVSLTFSPDGKTLVAGYGDALMFWDATARKVSSRLRKEELTFRSVTFAPDGKLLAAFGAGSIKGDVRIILWNTTWAAEAPPMEVERLGGLWYYLMGLDFSADGRIVTGVYTDRAIRQWELASGKEARVIAQPEPNPHATIGLVRTAAFAPDHRLVALAQDRDTSVRLWDMEAGKELRILEPHEGVIFALAFSPDGKRLVSGHQGGSILVWDISEQAKAAAAPPARDLLAVELDQLWAALGGDDAALAFRATRILAGGSDKTALVLGERLQAPQAHPLPEEVRQLLLRLDHEFPAVRGAAALELKNYSAAVDPLLRKVLEGLPSVQVRLVLEAHLKSNQRGLRLPAGELLRTMRAIGVLEQMDSVSARRSLETLAKGPPENWSAQEARSALERQQARSKQP